MLANQIKEDLEKDLEETKKKGGDNLTYINRPWGGCGIPCGEEGYIVLVRPDAPKNKGKRDLIAPNELEKEDYDEIVSLIKEIQTTREKVAEQKRQEWETKMDQKLSSNPKMFLYEGVVGSDDDEGGNHYFQGIENGQKFHLLFPQNHPVANSLLSQKNSNSKKRGIYYLIEGAENIPLKNVSSGYGNYEKTLKLTDQITITPADNTVYLETLEANKADFEKYLAKVQAEHPEEDKEIADAKKRFEELEEEIQEEKNWLAQNGNKLPTPSKNQNNPPNSQSKELNDKLLLQHFQKNNIESIKLEGEKLIIKCDGNSTIINLQTFLNSSPELKGIDKYLQNKSDKTVSLRELVQNNTDQNTKPQNSNSALWICGIGGTLIIAVVIGMLLKKKSKIKKH